MDVLFDIPVLGFGFQFFAYVLNAIFTTNLPAQTLQLATPVALGALCGVMNERSGIVNIGIEGMMLTAAFVGFMAAMVVDQAMPDVVPGVDPRGDARPHRGRARGDRRRDGASPCSTPGCRSASGPTRSSAAR